MPGVPVGRTACGRDWILGFAWPGGGYNFNVSFMDHERLADIKFGQKNGRHHFMLSGLRRLHCSRILVL